MPLARNESPSGVEGGEIGDAFSQIPTNHSILLMVWNGHKSLWKEKFVLSKISTDNRPRNKLSFLLSPKSLCSSQTKRREEEKKKIKCLVCEVHRVHNTLEGFSKRCPRAYEISSEAEYKRLLWIVIINIFLLISLSTFGRRRWWCCCCCCVPRPSIYHTARQKEIHSTCSVALALPAVCCFCADDARSPFWENFWYV